MPRGGRRPGAGRKLKDRGLAALHGSRQRTVVRFPAPAVAVSAGVPAAPVACPEPLDEEAAAVWERLAPHALAAQTLTDGTAQAFALLCRQVVLERKLAACADAGHASHRGMMQRVEAGYVRFALAPMGKPIMSAKPVEADPFAEFERIG